LLCRSLSFIRRERERVKADARRELGLLYFQGIEVGEENFL
jgi:hypothetical protein